MNILFVTYNTCARAAKEAKALQGAGGHQVIVLQYAAASEDILYTTTELSSFYRNRQGLIDRIAHFSDWVEVIHVHNEPNWIVSAAAEARNAVCPWVPLVFDVHDLDSQRENGEIDMDEEPAIHSADAFIFPSKSYEKGIRHVWNTRGAPGRVIYSMCNRSDIVESPLPRIEGLVYEGATVSPLPHFNATTPGYKHYRDYTELAAHLLVRQIPFHLYGVRKEFWRQYLDRGAIVHESLAFVDMMQQLTRYDWGLCGHSGDHPQWQKAMPNKLFEYLAAGIPVVSINAGEVSEFINEHGLGYAADGLDYLSRIARDSVLRNAYADNVIGLRHKFTMESQVPEIEALYGEAAAYRQSRLGAGVHLRPGQAGVEACGSWLCFEKPEASAKAYVGGDKLQPELRRAHSDNQEKAQGKLSA